MPLAILATFLSIRGFIRSNGISAIAFGLIAIIIGILILPTIPKMFPLRHVVEPASFNNATVADVLRHIAKSKDDAPYWRFYVSRERLSGTRISMTIPPNSTLGEILDMLMTETGASYRWGWHKCCGNEPSPLCASFYISRDVDRDGHENVLLIDRHDSS